MLRIDNYFWPNYKADYSKTCLNGHLCVKDNLYIKDTLQSSKKSICALMSLYLKGICI